MQNKILYLIRNRHNEIICRKYMEWLLTGKGKWDMRNGDKLDKR